MKILFNFWGCISMSEENWIDVGDMISFDLENRKIHIKDTFRKKNYKMIDFSDVISLEERRDSKTHIKRGNGSALAGGIVGAALNGGAGAIAGMKLGKGISFYHGLARMKMIYRYQGKEKIYLTDSSSNKEYDVFRQCCEKVMDIVVIEE